MEKPQTQHPFVLFVCSGNTCRSPMAEVIARDLAESLALEGISFRSAGTSTVPGLPASEGAFGATRRHGLRLEDHRSTPLSVDLVQTAELVLTMSPAHLIRVVELGGEGKAELLSVFASPEGNAGIDPSVPDPFGGDDEIYEATFLTLQAHVKGALERMARKGEGE